MYSTYIHHNTWQFILTSLKKSPIHLAIIRVNISGRPKVMLPVASMRITVKLIVIRTTPPSWAAAPTRAYLPGSIHPWQNKFISGKCQWKNLRWVTIMYQINKLIIAIHIHEMQTCYFKAIKRIETTTHKCQILHILSISGLIPLLASNIHSVTFIIILYEPTWYLLDQGTSLLAHFQLIAPMLRLSGVMEWKVRLTRSIRTSSMTAGSRKWRTQQQTLIYGSLKQEHSQSLSFTIRE